MSEEDYFILLESSKEHLEHIKELEKHLPNNEHLHLEMSKSIRYFSSDIESALDYIIYDLFMLYSYPKLIANNATENKIKHLQKVSFPSWITKGKFYSFMKKSFKDLQTDYPLIYDLLESNQPFNDKVPENHWLHRANEIVNTSKHRHLTKTDKHYNGVIRQFRYRGLSMSNVTFKGVGSIMNIGGIEITPEIARQIDSNFDGDVTLVSTFTDTNEPVIELLEEIRENTYTLITHLHQLMKEIE